MGEPEPVVDEYEDCLESEWVPFCTLQEGDKFAMRRETRTTRHYKQRICQLDGGEVTKILHVRSMAANCEEGEFGRKTVDQPEQRLHKDDEVDEVGEDSFRQDCVLLDELGEIVESRGCGVCQCRGGVKRELDKSVPMARVRKQKPRTTPT
jgi:hypothetical protein